ncbi:hypothetical protein STPYR_12834 [uncultured Stenotrophomonas sp.]|uniref:Uncharacterized protein n=1 Tax=uncultured Stenotrophomonas sp. TaxID=165438 RepID=A0A1Y5Q6N1_9GAMM|nr:hypothetical protein STPYR_12834 [uncultured Stenotrophomonas sp.]
MRRCKRRAAKPCADCKGRRADFSFDITWAVGKLGPVISHKILGWCEERPQVVGFRPEAIGQLARTSRRRPA